MLHPKEVIHPPYQFRIVTVLDTASLGDNQEIFHQDLVVCLLLSTVVDHQRSCQEEILYAAS
jgi:hypothetical protein